MMNNRFAMNDDMLEQVNGGYSWEEFKEDVHKAHELGQMLEGVFDFFPFW